MLCNETSYYSWRSSPLCTVSDLPSELRHFVPARQWLESLQLHLLKYQYFNSSTLPVRGPSSHLKPRNLPLMGVPSGWELSVVNIVVRSGLKYSYAVCHDGRALTCIDSPLELQGLFFSDAYVMHMHSVVYAIKSVCLSVTSVCCIYNG